MSKTIKQDLLTGEGILVWITNVVIGVAAVLPNGLSWTHAGLYIAIVTAAHTLATRLTATNSALTPLVGEVKAFDPVDPAAIASVVSALTGGPGPAAADEPKAAEQQPSVEEPEGVAPQPVAAAPEPQVHAVTT